MYLAHETSGEGPNVVLLHGLTATRNRVIHGSRRLERAGFRTTAYDARSHGDSDPPSTAEDPARAYSYEALADDLESVIEQSMPADEPYLLAGSSMGAHTAIRHAMQRPRNIAGLVLIGPAVDGSSRSEDELSYWDDLSDGLRKGGVDGFIEVFERGLTVSVDWRQRIVDLERDLMSRHRHLDALADAIKWVPRSAPFESTDELCDLRIPSLIVASDDEVDPGHPLAVARAWAEALPEARLRIDRPGETPLAWSGGRLCEVIADFAASETDLVR